MTRHQTTLIAVQAGVGLAVLIAASEARLALLAVLAAGSLTRTRARYAAPAAAFLVCLVAGVALTYSSAAPRPRRDVERCAPRVTAVVREALPTPQHPIRIGHLSRSSTTALRGC